jgi:hypothetical protein
MSNDRFVPASRPAAAAPAAWQPAESEADWERVLDCGAPGPAREQPALFYQETRAQGAEIYRAEH